VCSSLVQKSGFGLRLPVLGGRPHNMSALGLHISVANVCATECGTSGDDNADASAAVVCLTRTRVADNVNRQRVRCRRCQPVYQHAE